MFWNLDNLDTLGERKAPQISDSDLLLLFIDRLYGFLDMPAESDRHLSN